MNDNIARGRIASSLQDRSLNSGGFPITKNKRHQQRQGISSTCTRGIAAKAGNIWEFSYNSENLALNPAIIGSDQGVGNRQRGSIVDNKTANPHETFLRLWMKHEPELRAFVRSCCPRAQEVDDVMQEVSIAALRKFPTLDDHAAFGPWSCLVARYEILSARRKHARDRLVLSEDILLMLADEGANEMDLRKEQLRVLDQCISKLPDDRRELAITAYSHGTTIREMAKRMRKTEGSLYQMLARIRIQLRRCVSRELPGITT